MKRFAILFFVCLVMLSGTAYTAETSDLNSYSMGGKEVKVTETVMEDGIHAVEFVTPAATMSVCYKSEINTEELGWIPMTFSSVKTGSTPRGDFVSSGYYYVNNGSISWGSINNPEAFTKVWWDVGGRIDLNFFHVSVPSGEFYTNYSCSTSCASWWDQSWVPMNTHARHWYYASYCGL